MSAIGGAIVGAAASLAGTGANMIQTGKLNKKGRKFTAEQNALNRQQTWDMWNATNEFNLKHSDPAFVMQRYKDAGLNPWLIYGQPGSVDANQASTQNHPMPQQMQTDINIGEAYNKFMQARMMQKTLDLQDAEIDNKRASANQSQASADLTNQQKDQQQELFGGQKQLQDLDIKTRGLSNDKIVKEIASIGVQMNKSNQEIQNMKSAVAKTLVEIKTLQGQMKVQEAELKAKQLANRLFENTLESKAAAENAYNKLMSETAGFGKTSFSQMPGLIIGSAIKIIQDNFGSSKEEKKSKEEWLQKRWQEFKRKK